MASLTDLSLLNDQDLAPLRNGLMRKTKAEAELQNLETGIKKEWQKAQTQMEEAQRKAELEAEQQMQILTDKVNRLQASPMEDLENQIERENEILEFKRRTPSTTEFQIAHVSAMYDAKKIEIENARKIEKGCIIA